MRRTPIAVAALLMFGWTSHTSVSGDSRTTEQVRVIKAFYEWFYLPEDVPRWGQLAAEVHGLRPPSRTETYYFVEVFKIDPSPALLLALTREGAVFLPGSQFRPGKGVRFYVAKIEFASPTRAIVVGGHWFHELGARSGTYELIKEDGQWKVLRTIEESIS